MKVSKIKKLESKYIFGFSTVVWYVIILSTAGLIVVSLLLFLWGLTPTFKHKPVKAEYPQPVMVSLQELQSGSSRSQNKPQTVGKLSQEPGQAAYLASLNQIKKLIPPSKYSWLSKGHWERTWYEKKWVVDRLGTRGYLYVAYKRAQVSSFLDKKQLLDAYASVLSLFPEKNRMNVLKALVEYTKKSLAESLPNVELLRDSVEQFSTDHTKYIAVLAKFGAKNPRDGHTFILYVNKIINRFKPSARADVLDSLIAGYYKYFNNTAQQVEATDSFMALMPGITPELRAKTLMKYYSLYVKKNALRQRTVNEIDAAYTHDVVVAKSKYEAQKVQKFSYLIKGLLGVLLGIGAIAVIILLLALLAIQRDVRKIEAYYAQEEK